MEKYGKLSLNYRIPVTPSYQGYCFHPCWFYYRSGSEILSHKVKPKNPCKCLFNLEIKNIKLMRQMTKYNNAFQLFRFQLLFVLKKVLVDRNRATIKHTRIIKSVVGCLFCIFFLSFAFQLVCMLIMISTKFQLCKR